MGNMLDRIRGRSDEEQNERDNNSGAGEEFHDARSEHLRDPIEYRLVGTMPFTRGNWTTFLQGLLNLILNTLDNDAGGPHHPHGFNDNPVRYTLVPRYDPLIPRPADSPQTNDPRSVWMSDEWLRLFARALRHRQEDIWAVSQGRTKCGLLHLAARMNFPLTTYEIVRDNSVLVDIRDENGNTPLMEAANYASFETLLVLLRCGANPALRNNRGETAVHVCVSKPECYERKREKCLALLLEQPRTRINTPDIDGNTPLHRASGTHRVSERMLVYLVRSGADGSVKNNDGQTPLHYYLQCLSNWTEVFASIISTMPAILQLQTRMGLRAIYTITPKFQSMLTDNEGNHPSIVNMGGFQVFKEAFFRKTPLSLQEMSVDVVRRYVGLDNIFDKTQAWRELRIPRHLRKVIREHKLRELFDRANLPQL